jgi:hypothetical protein
MEDVDLNWDDFEIFYKLLYSTIAILEHVIAKFKEFTTFFRFLSCLQGRKKIPLVGLDCTHQVAKG